MAMRTLLLAVLVALAAPAAADTAVAYDYINLLRGEAGMIPFSSDANLAAAAQNHADYLDTNQLAGHGESSSLPGYTGADPSARVAYAGYRSTSVTENVSTGQASEVESVDALMSAIYHRFGFLDFGRDEIGAGIAGLDSGYGSFVYNMGNAGVDALCSGSAYSGSGSYYYNVCNPDIHIATAGYTAAWTAVEGANPALVVWPPENGVDIPPVFFEESPDPLPDYSVSGYPVSLQFNPGSTGTVALTSFTLWRDDSGAEVTPTRLLDASSDPNGRFGDLQFALFPLQRLDWNTTYRAEASYTADGTAATKSWRFTTRDLGIPVYTVVGGESLTVAGGDPFAVYIAPTSSYPTMGGYSYRTSGGAAVEGDWIDGNTIKLTVTGSSGAGVKFTTSSQVSFTVTVGTVTNRSPTVSAGADQTVTAGSAVTLSGSAADSDGTIAKYQWQQTGGSAVTLTGSTSAGAGFTAPTVTATTTLTFRLTVTDNGGASASDSVAVTVTPATAQLTCDTDGNGRYTRHDATLFSSACGRGNADWLCDVNGDGRYNRKDLTAFKAACG